MKRLTLAWFVAGLLVMGCACPVPPGHALDSGGFLVPLEEEDEDANGGGGPGGLPGD